MRSVAARTKVPERPADGGEPVTPGEPGGEERARLDEPRAEERQASADRSAARTVEAGSLGHNQGGNGGDDANGQVETAVTDRRRIGRRQNDRTRRDVRVRVVARRFVAMLVVALAAEVNVGGRQGSVTVSLMATVNMPVTVTVIGRDGRLRVRSSRRLVPNRRLMRVAHEASESGLDQDRQQQRRRHERTDHFLAFRHGRTKYRPRRDRRQSFPRRDGDRRNRAKLELTSSRRSGS